MFAETKPGKEKVMDIGRKHISVCICTYRRPQLLQRLLHEVVNQETNGLFTYSVVVVDNEQGRTGNVILNRRIFEGLEQPFRPEFRGGGDKEFFRRMIEAGYKFIWSADAVAYEVVPPVRWKRTFLLKRALFRGALVPLHATFGPRNVVKSLIAVPTYSLMLPFALLFGQHWFMKFLVKLCDHLGMLFALVGIRPMRQPYVTE